MFDLFFAVPPLNEAWDFLRNLVDPKPEYCGWKLWRVSDPSCQWGITVVLETLGIIALIGTVIFGFSSVRAAFQSNRIAEQSLIYGSRAYLGLKCDPKPNYYDDASYVNLHIRTVISNVGPTPATAVELTSALAILEKNDNGHWEIPHGRFSAVKSLVGDISGHSEEVVGATPKLLTSKLISENPIKKGMKIIHLSQLRYAGIFPGTESEHVSLLVQFDVENDTPWFSGSTSVARNAFLSVEEKAHFEKLMLEAIEDRYAELA